LLRLLIFLPIFLYSQETFLLPDDADHLMDTIYKQVNNADREVLIFTPYLDDYMLIKHLKRLAKKGTLVTLITQEPISKENKVLRLSLFNNISIFTLKPFNYSDDLKGSFLCIDDQKLFMLSEDIDSKMMKRRYAFALFEQQPCRDVFHTLLKRSKAY